MSKNLWASKAKAAGSVDVDTSPRARIEGGGVHSSASRRPGVQTPAPHKRGGGVCLRS